MAAFERKYELTDDIEQVGGQKLFRIRAVRDFSDVKAGDLGGWVASDGVYKAGRLTALANLDHNGDCWLYDNAKSFYGGRICGDAKMYEDSEVIGRGLVGGRAKVRDNIVVDGRNSFQTNSAIVGTDCDVSGSGHIVSHRSGLKKQFEPKYEFTGERKDHEGILVKRIRALRSFGDVAKGDLGGWIEHERNLAHDGEAWVGNSAVAAGMSVVRDNAQMTGQAAIYDSVVLCDDARMMGNSAAAGHASVRDRALLMEDAYVHEYARIADDACVSGRSEISGSSEVSGEADVSGDVVVRDRATVMDHAILTDNVVVRDQATVCGWSRLSGKDVISDEEVLGEGPEDIVMQSDDDDLDDDLGLSM